jgi:hypothetical protein
MGVPVPGETALVAAALYAGKTLVYAAHRAHASLNRHHHIALLALVYTPTRDRPDGEGGARFSGSSKEPTKA